MLWSAWCCDMWVHSPHGPVYVEIPVCKHCLFCEQHTFSLCCSECALVSEKSKILLFGTWNLVFLLIRIYLQCFPSTYPYNSAPLFFTIIFIVTMVDTMKPDNKAVLISDCWTGIFLGPLEEFGNTGVSLLCDIQVTANPVTKRDTVSLDHWVSFREMITENT